MILSYVHTTEGKQHVGIFIFKENDKLLSHTFVSSTHRHERDSNSQL
jgi:hypothetical protein